MMLLSTAFEYVQCVQGEITVAHLIIDIDSIHNLITNEFAELLCTSQKMVKLVLNGLSKIFI